MRKLLLIRHSVPDVQPGTPPASWSLSAEGQSRCLPLASALRRFQLTALVTSSEQKARETGALLAEELQLPLSVNQSLHEQDRTGAPFLPAPEFQNAIRTLLEQPEKRIYGNETGRQALQRFSEGVETVLATHPHGNLGIVTHGTVLTLFVAARAGIAPFPFWKKLGLPAYVALQLPEYTLAESAFTV